MRPVSTKTLIIAAIIYTAIIVVLAIVVSPNFYLALIALAFGRPVLREVGALADRDEWLSLVSYRSSHIAFLTAMLIAGLIFMYTGIVKGGEPPYEVSLILLVALFVKFAALQLMGRSRERAGRAIVWIMGGGWLLFVLASHGLSLVSLIEGGPFLALVACALLARRWPRIVGIVVGLIGIGTIVAFVDFPLEYKRLIVPFLLSFPLLLSGALLILGDRADGEEEAPLPSAEG
jgi:hypothetical protein